jgi:chromosome partitioning protein
MIMPRIHGSSDLHRIVVLNPKGGAGKTTLAFNLAGYFASTGRKVALIDMDQQGSSSHWLDRRPAELPPIHGVSAPSFQAGARTERSITLPPDVDLAVVDSPAGIAREELADYTVGSHAIIVPVMPSEFDVHAASRLIADLLLVARVSRESRRLGVVASRVKERTVAYRQLMKFLGRLSIPVVGVVRDSQNYVGAAREGLCIHDLLPSRASKDLAQWAPIIAWLQQRLATPLDEKDLRHPRSNGRKDAPPRRSKWRVATAAALALAAVSALLPNFDGPPGAGVFVAPVAATDHAGRDQAGAAEPARTLGRFAGGGEKPPGLEAASPAPAAPERLSSAHALQQKWQLSAVVRQGRDYAVLLTDRSGLSTRKVTTEVDVDGWLVEDAGPSFAVLAKAGEQVRLQLSNPDPESKSTTSPEYIPHFSGQVSGQFEFSFPEPIR